MEILISLPPLDDYGIIWGREGKPPEEGGNMMKKIEKAVIVICVLAAIVFLILGAAVYKEYFGAWAIVSLLCIVGAVFVYIDAAKRQNTAIGKFVKGIEKKQADKQRIVAVYIIGSASKAKTSSAIGRAIIGDLVAGGVGSVVGASTAKKDGMTKFLVEYADGHREVETEKDNSPRFKELIAYVKL